MSRRVLCPACGGALPGNGTLGSQLVKFPFCGARFRMPGAVAPVEAAPFPATKTRGPKHGKTSTQLKRDRAKASWRREKQIEALAGLGGVITGRAARGGRKDGARTSWLARMQKHRCRLNPVALR